RQAHAHARPARGLERLLAAHRRRAPARGRLAAGGAAARLRLRPDRARRGSGDPARRARPRARADQDRALPAAVMGALAGNPIAGQLEGVFGAELTTATGTCAHCGAVRQVAELRVYLRVPGTVVRCPSCQGIVMVLVEVRGVTCVDLLGLARLE